jgi:hypothetical protein
MPRPQRWTEGLAYEVSSARSSPRKYILYCAIDIVCKEETLRCGKLLVGFDKSHRHAGTCSCNVGNLTWLAEARSEIVGVDESRRWLLGVNFCPNILDLRRSCNQQRRSRLS